MSLLVFQMSSFRTAFCPLLSLVRFQYVCCVGENREVCWHQWAPVAARCRGLRVKGQQFVLIRRGQAFQIWIQGDHYEWRRTVQAFLSWGAIFCRMSGPPSCRDYCLCRPLYASGSHKFCSVLVLRYREQCSCLWNLLWEVSQIESPQRLIGDHFRRVFTNGCKNLWILQLWKGWLVELKRRGRLRPSLLVLFDRQVTYSYL
jgi:hypothetical protein